MSANTLPKQFLEVVKERPEKTALRHKDLGIWNEVSWKTYKENVEYVFHALKEHGIVRGDRVAVISENCLEWVYIELGVQSIGAMTVGMFVQSLSKEIVYTLNHSEAKIIICEDQEQTDKILELKDELKFLEKIITIDMRGMRNYKDSLLISWHSFIEMGKKRTQNNPTELEQTINQAEPDDGAMLLYTSGTTGNPKAVILSHLNIMTVSNGVIAVDPMNENDEILSYLPMAWVGERLFSLFLQLRAKYIVNFPEEMDMNIVMQNIEEIKPSVILFSPPVWENLASMIQIKIDNSTFLKRKLYNLFMPLAQKTAEKKLKGEKITGFERFIYFLGDISVFGAIRERLGLNFSRVVYTGGSSIGPELFSFFHALGIELRQAYGQTETCGIITLHPRENIRPESVGNPIPGMEVKINENGEILVKSEGVFKEYFRDPASTEKTKIDGWLYTGDNGFINELGQIVVIDRAKDVFRLNDGTEFSPQLLENRLKFSPYIKQAVVIGNNREYVSALIQIDLDNVGNWAQKRRIPYTTFRDLTQKKKIQDLIMHEIEDINSRIEAELRIKEISFFLKELDPDDGELTRTNKVKRNVIEDVYSKQIESLYDKNIVDRKEFAN